MATPAWVKYARAMKVRNATIRYLKGERAVLRATIETLTSSDTGKTS
jgi:hypothetical protein